jgi:hypothetical protein
MFKERQSVMNKVRTFLLLNRETKWLFAEAFIYLAWARILKALPFSKVAPSLGKQMKETDFSQNKDTLKTLKNISHAIHIMSRYTLWESQCLVKAMAGMKMLERRNIESTLYLGTGRDEAGKMMAHAWLRSGSFYLSGAEVMKEFTVVCKFAKETVSLQTKN